MPEFVLGVELCEDLWVPEPPSGRLARWGATVIANPSASDETIGKAGYRRLLVASQSARLMAAYVYADAGAGESVSDMVFAGHDLIGENGTLLAESQRFTEGLIYADLDLDCSGIEGAFTEGFAKMVRFIGLFYSLMGRGDFAEEKAEIILNRDIIISESDAVEQCAGSAGLLSRRTVLENHPWVVNVEEELDRLRAEAGKKEDTEDEPEGHGGRTVGSGACADPERPAAV